MNTDAKDQSYIVLNAVLRALEHAPDMTFDRWASCLHHAGFLASRQFAGANTMHIDGSNHVIVRRGPGSVGKVIYADN